MTQRLVKLIEHEASLAGKSPEKRKPSARRLSPWGASVEVQEFGKVGAFLLSPAASYLSGQTILVDGAASKFLY
jgi:3-oxoacyl-[acyl-carrier protein] reductase